MNNSYLKSKFKSLAMCLVFLAGFIQANAQCNCDHTVPLSIEVFDGDTEGVSPGDVICVEDGTRDRLHFENIEGTASNPVVIKNCGGQVVINGTGGGSGNVPLALNGNKHFHLTGTGDASYQYGFKVGGEAHASVEAQGQATNFELDHIEVVSAGFAGFMLKTDPDGSGENVRPNAPSAVNGGFAMYDVSVHDCYIHDILPDGEGIYLGNSFWQTGHPPTGGQYPHNIYGAKIYNNVFDKTGREAIQAGCVVEGLEIYNNEIYNYGWNNTSDSQNNGIQIGQGSSGRVYNNYFNNEANTEGSRAIYVMGIGDNYVYNNVVVGGGTPSGEGGSVIINANLKDAPLPGDPGYDTGGFIGGAYFMNNTIIDTKGVAEVFGTYLNDAPNNVLYNNLVVTPTSNWDGISGSNWTKADNIRYANEGAADFVDAANEDYNLQSSSSAVNAGTDVSSYDVDIDFTGASRPVNNYDVGAYEYGASGGNVPPILGSINDPTVEEDDTLYVNVSATDSDGDDITLTASNLPSFASFTDHGDDTGTLTIVPQQGDEGNYTGVEITADDGNGGDDTEIFTITVDVAGNNAPVLSSIGDPTVEEDDTLDVNVTASDPDGDDITLTASNLPSFASFTDHGDDTGTLTITPQQGDEGTYTGAEIAADDGNGADDMETFTITVENDSMGGGGAGTPIYRVNAGGALESDAELDWEKDKQTDPVTYFDDANSVNYTTGSDTWSGTNNTNAPDNIFGPYRYDNGATWGERQHWDFPVDNGDYEVRLYFNAVSTTSGTNVFDVEIEGNVELNDYDIYATAGGQDIPVEESFYVTVSDDNLDIDFPLESGESIINGIEILSAESNDPPVLSSIGDQTLDEEDTLDVNVSATDPDGDDITLSATNLPSFATFTDHGDDTGTLTITPAEGDAGTYTSVEITADDGNGEEDSEIFTITVEDNDTGSGGTVLYRVNAGGQFEEDGSVDWEKDKQTDPVSYFDDANCVNYTTGSDNWSGTNNTNAPDNIFGPYRYDNGAGWGDRQHWDFSVSNGDYEVRLYFNAVSTSAGTNVFDVEIEGNVELNDYDIYATAGGQDIPVEESVNVTVNDGNLDIDFPLETGYSIINGIEILSAGTSQRVGEEASERSVPEEIDAVNVVYPNPINDNILVEVQGIESKSVDLYLLDSSGRVLRTTQMDVENGYGEKSMNIADLNLSSGIYFMKIKTDNFLEVKKLVKD